MAAPVVPHFAPLRGDPPPSRADRPVLPKAGRCCDFVAGSLLDVAPDLLAAASAVLLLVCLPSGPQRQAADLLRPAATGCRVVCYAALHGVAEGCRLAPSGDAAALVLPTSWTPSRGHSFASYVVAGSSSEAADGNRTALSALCVQRFGAVVFP